MSDQKVKNRWLIALCAVGIHISIGSVYAWSNFTTPLGDKFGWSSSQVQFTFSLAILFLGLSAAFLGWFVEKYGPRVAGITAAIFFGIGVAGSGFAVQMGSLWLLYIFYGVLGGVGLGVGYIAPVSTLVKWFPDRRGLATGMAIMGFGFAAAIASPVMDFLINAVGIAMTFYILGVSYFIIMILSSLYIERPPEGWKPEGFEGETGEGNKKDLAYLSAKEALKTKRFYYLWIMLFINVTCGIAVISAAKPLAVESVGMSTAAAATLVGVMGIFNGGGRIGWASLSDYIGRGNTYLIFFILQIALFILLPWTTVTALFVIFLAVIYTCYGGGFSTLPAFIGDLFGTKELGAIHGFLLTAWAAAGLVGPIFAAWMKDTTGSYESSLLYFAGFFVIALIVSILTKIDIRKKRKENKANA
ncbi:MFS transporter, OFA family, oxalate/formate antiporter [Thalassobacillus cyri]|uniref:MFS transporter, OFA family, oxalate/formate antiporter n=1 Tax=Thalassobacillus cyri TaxID=571932 RepID=A0A1H3Y8J7_9BACI|nr:OFA family MFS transporter [Thalassobacillus cyri]SEA07178.1 MFS transporter, OFA family, oxalate/formate antiporter [Thalassobacillus cyri]